MNKTEYMQKLRLMLQNVKESDREEILYDYEEHFRSGFDAGKSEEDIARELGAPEDVARPYVENLPPAPQPSSPMGLRVAKGILIGLALLLINAIIAIPIIAVLIGIWCGFLGGVIAIFAVGLAGLIAPLGLSLVSMPFSLPALPLILFGIALLGLSVVLGIGFYYLTKYFVIGLIAYVKMNIRMIREGSK